MENASSEIKVEQKIIHPAIYVRAFKYNGVEHKSWQAKLLRRDGSLLILDAKFADEVQHDILGTVVRGTISLEYYWLDRWFSIFRFSEPTGELRNFYCNINMPPTLEDNVLSYVDLDIDILVQPDFSYTILDEEEFAANAVRYNYPPEMQKRARLAVDELTSLIEKRQFPFDNLK